MIGSHIETSNTTYGLAALKATAALLIAASFVLLASAAVASAVSNHADAQRAPAAGRYLDVPFLSVSEQVQENGFTVAANGQAAPIHYAQGDAAVVGIASRALRDDIRRVTGAVPALTTVAPAPGSSPILIGTLGKNAVIDGLVAAGKLDVSRIAGRWEAYVAAVIDDPLPGIARALVIAGSDRRGTAFGVFGLSEAMGVSPWHFWADVPSPASQAVHVQAGMHVQPSPGVKYRGIFLNDEDWGLQPWASKTFEPEVGNIGPRTYASIFELLLRLHANVIWPAMHEFPRRTTPFYLVPGNKQTADDYAIVIATSHHEPMLRNSHEYDEHALGPYDYWTNRDNIRNFWEQRVVETAGFESIYTMGMRGRSDSGLIAPSGTTDAQRAQKIQQEIIPDQRRMLAAHVNSDVTQVPQIFIPYKETLVQYQAGLQLPDDVTIVWPDDNHGYIRQLSSTVERKRSGGSGVYYHLSYWGQPRSYLWFCTTPPGMTRAEMMKAWDFEARRIWLVNVGDLKPNEIGAEFFLRLARNPEAFRDFDQRAYLAAWAGRTFGPRHAAAIADVLEGYYRLNIVVRPEHLDHGSSGFDFTGARGRGDEAQTRLDEFAALVGSAESIQARLPADARAAFYELVLYPLRASALINRKVLLAERSRLWAEQGRAATAVLSAAAQAADVALRQELEFYNRRNAGGKWMHMLSPMAAAELPAWAQDTQSPFYMPKVGDYAPPDAAGLGVAVEGADTPQAKKQPGGLRFHRATNARRFVDIFNTGVAPLDWTGRASAPWVQLSQRAGQGDARIYVSIDWSRVPQGRAASASIEIRGAGVTRVVPLEASNPAGLDTSRLPTLVENDGEVVLPATASAAQHDSQTGAGWRRLSHATAGGDGMAIQPVTVASVDPSASGAEAPSLTYEFQTLESGPVEVMVKCLPTHRITSDHAGLRYAISINGGPRQVVDLQANEYSRAWDANVLRAWSAGVSTHHLTTAGRQLLTIQMVDPGVVLDRIEVRFAPKNQDR